MNGFGVDAVVQLAIACDTMVEYNNRSVGICVGWVDLESSRNYALRLSIGHEPNIQCYAIKCTTGRESNTNGVIPVSKVRL